MLLFCVHIKTKSINNPSPPISHTPSRFLSRGNSWTWVSTPLCILDAVSSVMSLRLLSAEDGQVLLMLCGHIETQPIISPTKSPGVAPLCPTGLSI